MINAIPIFGWIISAVFSFGLAVPAWFFWTLCGFGETYFYFVPEVYHNIPFWHWYGLFVLVSTLKGVLTPHFGSPPIPDFSKSK